MDGNSVAGSDSCARRRSSAVVEQLVERSPPEPSPPKKPLKLSDNELLSLFRGAQKEASLEADWRGIQDPPSRRGDGSEGGLAHHRAPVSLTDGADTRPPSDHD